MGLLDQFYRYAEPAATLGSGMLAEPVAGWAGILGGGDAVERTRQAMTYQPRTEQGQAGLNALANALQSAKTTFVDENPPVNALVKALQAGADYAGEQHPLLGAMAKTAPAALGLFAGPGAAAARNTFAGALRPAAPAADMLLENYMRATGGLLDMTKKGPRTTVTIPAADDVFDALGIPPKRVMADIDKLYRKHPEYFTNADEVDQHLQYVFGAKPDHVFPGGDPRYTVIVRNADSLPVPTGEANRMAATDFSGNRNGNYWVRSAYPMSNEQLEVKLKGKK